MILAMSSLGLAAASDLRDSISVYVSFWFSGSSMMLIFDLLVVAGNPYSSNSPALGVDVDASSATARSTSGSASSRSDSA